MDWAMAAESARGGGESGYWQLALVVAAIGFLGLFARWRKLRTHLPPSVGELQEREDNPNRYRDAADRAIVELLETSRSLNAQVDTKIRMLNRLIKDAEEQSERLENLINAARTRRLDDEETVQFAPEEGRRKSARVTPLDGAREKAQPERRFLTDLHERVHRLREAGKSVPEIAKATNLSTTEVEFIVKSLLE